MRAGSPGGSVHPALVVGVTHWLELERGVLDVEVPDQAVLPPKAAAAMAATMRMVKLVASTRA